MLRALFRLLILLSMCLSVFAVDSLTLRISAFRGSECDSSRETVVAGSSVMIWLTYRLNPNKPDSILYGSREWKYPDDFALHFRIADLNGASAEIPADTFAPRFAETYSQQVAREFWNTDPKIIPKDIWRRDLCVSIKLPVSIGGQTLSVTAILHRKGSNLSSTTDRIKVVPICSPRDSLMVLRSLVYFPFVCRRSQWEANYPLGDIVESFAYRAFSREDLKKLWDHSPVWSRYDHNIAELPGRAAAADQLFDLPEPDPNPLAEYRPLLIEKEVLKCGGDRSFLKPDPGQLTAGLVCERPESKTDKWGRSDDCLAGSPSALHVRWNPHTPSDYDPYVQSDYPHYEGLAYLGLDKGWPPGLSIKAGTVLDSMPDFTHSDSLLRELNLQYFYDGNLPYDDSLWHASPEKITWPLPVDREFTYILTIPETWVGRRFTFRVTYDHERYGRLETQLRSDLSNCAISTVVAPSTARDSMKIGSARIERLSRLHRCDEALALADSVLRSGELDFFSFNKAEGAAYRCNRPLDQIRFYDAEFRQLGYTMPRLVCGNAEPEPRDPVSETEWYLDTRRNLLQRAAGMEVPPRSVSTTIGLSLRTLRQSTCAPMPGDVIAGSAATLTISVKAKGPDSTDFPFPERENDWPKGMVLEVGEPSDSSGTFVPQPDLLSKMHFRLTGTPTEVLKSGNWEKLPDTWRQYSFRLNIPSDFAGKTVALRASLTGKKGKVLKNGEDETLKVITPCSRIDRDNAAAMEAYFAWQGGDYERAIQLADSLIAAKRFTEFTLLIARQAANYGQKPELALHYLDLAYTTYGHTDVLAPEQKITAEEAKEQYNAYHAALSRHISNPKSPSH